MLKHSAYYDLAVITENSRNSTARLYEDYREIVVARNIADRRHLLTRWMIEGKVNKNLRYSITTSAGTWEGYFDDDNRRQVVFWPKKKEGGGNDA